MVEHMRMSLNWYDNSLWAILLELWLTSGVVAPKTIDRRLALTEHLVTNFEQHVHLPTGLGVGTLFDRTQV